MKARTRLLLLSILVLTAQTLLSGCVMLPTDAAPVSAANRAVESKPVEPGQAQVAKGQEDSGQSIGQPAASANDEAESAPEPAVWLYEDLVTLPTYPSQAYQTPAIDPATRWPYQRFDRERFQAENPPPVNKSYRTIVLENRYLRLTILPELGGRLWQVVHKASGNHLFYQNSVVKPSPWGPPEQLGWLALGGLEWNLPVIEHGYDWGSEWLVSTQSGPSQISATLSTPEDGRYLNAEITITLYADLASFEVQPTLVNLHTDPLQFDYWHTAMLAPGPENLPSEDLHFVLPTYEVTVHSTGDATLPTPGEPMTWPLYRSRDLSRLGNWQEYLGLFEYPSARGPFVGVYDRAYNAGGVRVYPPKIARGSKLFGLGWGNALSSDYFTDDGTAYVELHGGLAPSFFEQTELAGQASVGWRESWYPVQGIGDLTFANELAAIYLDHQDSTLTVGLYPVLPIEGTLLIEKAGRELWQQPIVSTPETPLNSVISNIPKAGGETLDVRVLDKLGRELLTYSYK